MHRLFVIEQIFAAQPSGPFNGPADQDPFTRSEQACLPEEPPPRDMKSAPANIYLFSHSGLMTYGGS